ncbi:MAG TPA: PAC2 family protein [Nitrososphaeraceae archaeon]|jgi:proteasome assembly chaperone (PAC2) family protein
MLKVEILVKKKVDTFRIFASLPDMGRVGGLVSSFLASNLETEHIANIISNPKPWVNVKDGVIESTRDIYNIYFSDREKLLILTGEMQPEDHRELLELCNTFLDFCSSIGNVKRLYTAGGSLNEMLTGEPRVVGVATKPQLREILVSSDVDTLGSEFTTITWFNGLILGMASDRNIEAIGFYGEISDKSLPQPLAAKSIVKAFAKIEHLSISTKPFDVQYEEVLDHIERNKGTKNLDQ